MSNRLKTEKQRLIGGVLVIFMILLITLSVTLDTSSNAITKFHWYQDSKLATTEVYGINEKLKDIGITNQADRFEGELEVPYTFAKVLLSRSYMLDKIYYKNNKLSLLLLDGTLIYSNITKDKQEQIETILYTDSNLNSKLILGEVDSNLYIYEGGLTNIVTPLLFFFIFGSLGLIILNKLIFQDSAEVRGFLLHLRMHKFLTSKRSKLLTYTFNIMLVGLLFGDKILREISVFSTKSFILFYYGVLSILGIFQILQLLLYLKLRTEEQEIQKRKEKKGTRRDNNRYAPTNSQPSGPAGYEVYNEHILEDDWDESENEIKTTFADIAGMEEAKENLMLMQDYLFNPESYKARNLKIPTGTLLTGPPGNAKTALVRAYANECKVPFFYMSGSQFLEVFVGVGAARVREFFEATEPYEKAVMFIDEIDAIGGKRSSSPMGGGSEKENTLNQLLVELDGFKERNNLIILASTNRVDMLDPALIREGRFTEKINIPNPDYDDRKEILELFIGKTGLEYEVDLSSLAHMTEGFSGAKLEYLVTSTNLISKRAGRDNLTKADFINAFKETIAGKDKRHKTKREDTDLVAYHESGHALMYHLTGHKVAVMSVVPTTRGAGGFVMPKGQSTRSLHTKKYFLENIMVALGGRVAEEIKFGKENITTGASQDLENASNTIIAMTLQYAMFEGISMFSAKSVEELKLRGSEEQARVHRFMENKLQELQNDKKKQMPC